jgi:hypothetical protein
MNARRIGASSAALPVMRPASTQAYGCKHLMTPFHMILKLIRTNCCRRTEFTVLRKPAGISKNHTRELFHRERGAFVFDIHLVRTLCQDITEEKDPPRVEELLRLLQAVIKDDQEEVRLRMSFLTRKYAAVVSDSNAAD